MIKDEIAENLGQFIVCSVITTLLFLGAKYAINEGSIDNPRTIIEIKKKTLEGQIYHFNTLVQFESTCEVIEEHFESDDTQGYYVGKHIETSYDSFLMLTGMILFALFVICAFWGVMAMVGILHGLYLYYTS